MSSVNINVSVDELNRFAEYVSNFNKYVEGDCAELKVALSKLANTMDDESVMNIANMVQDISRILAEQGPELKNLEEKVRNYSEFVTQLKRLAGN